MRASLMLCGLMFGLPITRHRLFESNVLIVPPAHPVHDGQSRRFAAERGWDARDMTVTGKGRRAGTKERWREIMGWPDTPVTQHELREAIPPAYTEYIGVQLLAVVEVRRAA